MKAFTENKLNVAKMMISVFDRADNIVHCLDSSCASKIRPV